MRKIALLIALAALAGPSAALATKPPHPGSTTTTTTTTTTNTSPTTPSAKSLAIQACHAERTKDAVSFKATYHSLGLGKCVVKLQGTEQSTLNGASAQCRAWQNDATGFASTHNGSTFNQVYGTNSQAKGAGAGKNAFGKCVSSLAKQKVDSQVKTTMSAAKQCKSNRSSDPTGFAGTYGSGKNAFGACVSKLSKSTK